jgi:levanase/fructan beta-fructosidase
MKKLMTTIAAAVLMATSVQAQVQPNVLGENHAMVRVEQGKKYLCYPCRRKKRTHTLPCSMERTKW